MAAVVVLRAGTTYNNEILSPISKKNRFFSFDALLCFLARNSLARPVWCVDGGAKFISAFLRAPHAHERQ